MRINTVNFSYPYQSNNKKIYVSFGSKNEPIVLHDYLNDTLGFPTQESTQKTILYKNKFLEEFGANFEAFKLNSQKCLDSLISLFAKFNIKLQRDKGVLRLDKTPELNDIAKQELNDIILHKNALDLIYFDSVNKFLKLLTYSDMFPDVQYKNFNDDKLEGVYDSPIKKAQFIIGKLPDYDLKEVKEKANKLKKLPAIVLINKKEKVLDELNTFLASKKWLEAGAFLEKDKILIKNLVEQYTSLNFALGENKIITKEIENIYTKRNFNISTTPIGTYVDGEGLVVGKTEIFDSELQKQVPCTIFFKRSNRIFNLSIKKDNDYNEINDFVVKYDKLKNEISQNKNFDNIRKQLDDLSKKIILERNNSTIAYMGFKFDKLENLPKYFSLCNKKVLDSFLQKYNGNNDTPITYIANFANVAPKRYVNAGVTIGRILLNLLEEIDSPDIFIQAYNENKRSPVMLYLRAGFKPIYPNQKDLDAAITSKSEAIKNPIFMYKTKNI